MQQEAIQQLDDAVSEVFSMMLNRACRPARCEVPGKVQAMPLHVLQEEQARCVSAQVQFTGSMYGSCSLSLAQRTAEVITGELLGEESRGALVADTTGELCNIIAGSWKSRQPQMGSACTISSPSVAISRRCTPDAITVDSAQKSVSRTYRFEDHCLRLELTIKYCACLLDDGLEQRGVEQARKLTVAGGIGDGERAGV